MDYHDNSKLKKAGHVREINIEEDFEFIPRAYYYRAKNRNSDLPWPVIVTDTPPSGAFDAAYIVLTNEDQLSYVSGTPLIYSGFDPFGILIPKEGYRMATTAEFELLWDKLPR